MAKREKNNNRKESNEKRFNKRLLGAVVGGSLLGASSIYNKRTKSVGTSSGNSSNPSQYSSKKQQSSIDSLKGRVVDGVEGFSQRIHKK